MDKAKKKQVKKYIAWGCIAALVLGLAVMPLAANPQEKADGPQASVLSGTVQTGSVTTTLHGGGNLEAGEAMNVTIPSGVKITEFLVKNEDIVTEGTPLAAIDKVSLMSAIAQVQETLEHLREEMEDVKDAEVSSCIKATAGGRVKEVFAEEGDSVQDIMLEHGALAVLSLDGLMAVKIQRNMNITTGDSVCVTFSDDTEITGRVETNLNGQIVITVEDEGYAIGEKVTVTTDDGDRVGSGELYVHNAWKATAFTGTIKSVSATKEKTVSSGAALFTLTDTEFTAELESLANQHREYEELMLEMFKMYQNEAVLAPCDGMVSGIDEDSVHLLSGSGEWKITLLSNAPGADSEAGYTNYVGQITGQLGSDWLVRMNSTEQSVTDYTDLSGVDTGTENMTYSGTQTPVTVYTYVDGQWQITTANIGDILLFAIGDNGCVWAIYVGHADVETEQPPVTEPEQPEEPDPTVPSETVTPENPENPGNPEEPSEPSGDAADPTMPGDGEMPSGGMGGKGDLSAMAGMSGLTGGGSAAAVQEPEYELFDLKGSTLMTVTSQETMSLTITIDEQDISKIQVGQMAEVKVEALRGETFEAEVTGAAISGTNNGGSSKFTVELTMPLGENMIAGMSATASIPLYTKMDVLTIPVAALNENGAETVVYTALDEETGEPVSPVTVTTGVSDGETAEVLSGLNIGDSFYYSYYDTLELSTKVESGGGFSFGR